MRKSFISLHGEKLRLIRRACAAFRGKPTGLAPFLVFRLPLEGKLSPKVTDEVWFLFYFLIPFSFKNLKVSLQPRDM